MKSGKVPSLQSHFLTGGGLMVALTALAGLLRFYRLNREGIWTDEVYSIAIAQSSWHLLLKIVSTTESNMAFYYIVLHPWMALGKSEVVVRMLSAVAGVLTIPVVYLLCRRMYDERVAAIGSLFLAVNTYHIEYSQEARAYSFVVLFVALSFLFFVRAIERGKSLDWAGYVVFSSVAVYCHAFVVLVLGAQWLSLLVLGIRKIPWRQLVWSGVLIGLLIAPLAVCLLKDRTDHLGWIARPSLLTGFGIFAALSGSPLLFFAIFPAALFAVYFGIRNWKSSQSQFERWHLVLLLFWLLLPVLFLFLVSLEKPLFAYRYMIMCLPALVILAAVGFSWIPSRRYLAGALMISILLAAWSFWQYQRTPKVVDLRGASNYILSQKQGTDGFVFFVRRSKLVFDYYTRLHGQNLVTDAISSKWSFPMLEPDTTVQVPPNLGSRFPRIWMMTPYSRIKSEVQNIHLIEAGLAAQYRQVAKRSFLGADVLLYSDPVPASNGAAQTASAAGMNQSVENKK